MSTTSTPTGQLIGYARTSTLDQLAGLEAQERDLRAAGCTRVFLEQTSAAAGKRRVQLEAMLDYVREGDTLIVTKPDRLARSLHDLQGIIGKLAEKGVALRILSMNLDTSTPTGKLILNVLGSIAEFEREMMLERQKEGVAKAKTEGKYKGRAPTAQRKRDAVLKLRAEGVKPDTIAERLQISRASVYRILGDAT